MLDWISVIGNTVYVGLLVANMAVAIPRSATLRRLTIGVRLVVSSIAVQVVVLGAHLLDIPDDGWFGPVLSVASLTVSVPLLLVGRNRRELKGEQVVREANEIVRSYNPLRVHTDKKES